MYNKPLVCVKLMRLCTHISVIYTNHYFMHKHNDLMRNKHDLMYRNINIHIHINIHIFILILICEYINININIFILI